MTEKGSSISKQNSKKVGDPTAKRKWCTTCHLRLPRLISPVRYLKNVGGKVAAVMVRITTRATAAAPPRKSRDPPPPKTSVAPLDSQRAEAIHDCIDFINSSASLPRSNSVVAR